MSCFLVAFLFFFFSVHGRQGLFRSKYRFSQASWNICCHLLLFCEVKDPAESFLESLEIEE